MRMLGLIPRSKSVCLGLLAVAGLLGAVLAVANKAPAAGTKAGKVDPIALGREIFDREWLPGDGRSHGGDGLGPVYNDTSCVACHNSGGVGGGGPVSKNIDILSANAPGMGAIINPALVVQDSDGPNKGKIANHANPTNGATAVISPERTKALFDLHAGFRGGRTVVLHKFGTDPNYQAWRRRAMTRQNPNVAVIDNEAVTMVATVTGTLTSGATPSAPGAVEADVVEVSGTRLQNVAIGNNTMVPVPQARIAELLNTPTVSLSPAQKRLMEARGSMQSRSGSPITAGEFTVNHSQRNATALFGVGQIDSIPDSVIAAGAGQLKQFPEVAGRVSRLKDGRVGRLGWKGQIASVEDFVLTACAVELGLEVPGHEQALSPQAPKYRADGKDLTADECSSLVAYVRSIPRPLERASRITEEAHSVSTGKNLFANAGCASCHTPKLGNVDGIYSDLLLHDMGPELADSGSYGDDDGSDPLNPVLGSDKQVRANPVDRPAARQEWRTPPLWGFRDSAPYLHDGRAETLDQAVAGHGGQGQASALRYFDLSTKERAQLEAFMKTLVAPGAAGVEAAGE